MTFLRWSAALLVLAVATLTGCSSGDPQAAAPGPSPEPSVSASSAPPPPPAPKVGECHALSVTEATDPVDPTPPVPCRGPHTSVTVKVGELQLVVDGHQLAVDSKTVRKQIADACPASPAAFVGGDQTTQRLSRFEVVWFSPSLEQADAGANWYRCDVVALRSGGSLLPLPPRMKGVLDRPGALDRYGTCGSSAPDARDFERVVCSSKHAWRAVDVVQLPADAVYLGGDVADKGDAACKDVAAKRAHGSLKFTWSFEWPTRAQWAEGQRYGYCWVPEN